MTDHTSDYLFGNYKPEDDLRPSFKKKKEEFQPKFEIESATTLKNKELYGRDIPVIQEKNENKPINTETNAAEKKINEQNSSVFGDIKRPSTTKNGNEKPKLFA